MRALIAALALALALAAPVHARTDLCTNVPGNQETVVVDDQIVYVLWRGDIYFPLGNGTCSGPYPLTP